MPMFYGLWLPSLLPPQVIKMATPTTEICVTQHTYIYTYIFTFDTKEQGLTIRPTNDVAPMFKQLSLPARVAEIRVMICKLQWRLVP